MAFGNKENDEDLKGKKKKNRKRSTSKFNMSDNTSKSQTTGGNSAATRSVGSQRGS